VANPIPFDKARKRRFTRATSGSKGDFDLVSFRAPSDLLRKVDEIIAARCDPELRTRSDLMNDALHSWMSTFLDENPDLVPAVHDRFMLDRIEWLYASREHDLTTMHDSIRRADRERNLGLFHVILFNLMRFKAELEQDDVASPDQMKRCQEMITEVNKEMERGR
jgi:hypothetical protein